MTRKQDSTGQWLPTREVGKYDCSTIAATRGYIARCMSHMHPYEVTCSNGSGVSLMIEYGECKEIDRVIPMIRAFAEGYQLARSHYGTGR